jgi:putative membrane protein
MIRFVCAFAAALALAPAAFAVAPSAQQSTTAPPASTAMAPAASASTFVPTAASANLFEIESSQLALQRSQSPKVKDFAQRMVTDHNLAASKMKAALSEARIPAPPEKLDAKDQKVYDNLKAAKGAAFDKAYIEAQYNAHREAVSLFGSFAKNGDNARLKALAADLLPTLQGHLDHVSKLRSST